MAHSQAIRVSAKRNFAIGGSGMVVAVLGLIARSESAIVVSSWEDTLVRLRPHFKTLSLLCRGGVAPLSRVCLSLSSVFVGVSPTHIVYPRHLSALSQSHGTH